MTFELMPLPYPLNALEPSISAETLDYHYNKHHATYLNNLNKLVAGTPDEQLSLPDLIKKSTGAIFNNAAQVWNHAFYWQCLSPNGGGQPCGVLFDKICASFADFTTFQQQFTQAAIQTFGSGWCWLVQTPKQDLSIITTTNAQTPLTMDLIPLLTCDVWEHAYYIDYRNARAKYVEAFWQTVNWDFVAQNLR